MTGIHRYVTGIAATALCVALIAPAATAAGKKKVTSKKAAKSRYVSPSKLPKQPAMVTITGEKYPKTLNLVALTDTELQYVKGLRIEKIPRKDIQSVNFLFNRFDPYKVKVFEHREQFVEGAVYIVQNLAPALKYIKLPDNNLVGYLSDAAYLYLDAAATHDDKKGRHYDPKKAQTEYVKAYSVFKKITEADWYYGATLAHLNMAYCALKLKKRAIAEKLFKEIDPPEIDDAAFGLYWLVDGMMKFEDKKYPEALASAIKAVDFDSRDLHVFPQARLLTAYCYEDMLDYYRARDAYFEVARLFHDTPEGRIAFSSIQFIRARKLTDTAEAVGIEKVFFNSVEDVNKTIDEYIPKAKEQDKIRRERKKRLEEQWKREDAKKKKHS